MTRSLVRIIPVGLVYVASCLASHDVSAQSSSRSEWTSKNWKREDISFPTKDWGQRPDVETLAKLVVKWDRPTIDPLGTRVTLSGTLCMASVGDREARPIDWIQGVTVNLAKSAGSTPDWSSGSAPNETLAASTKTNRNGTFSVRFELRELRSNPAGSRQHQIGLALAEHHMTDTTRHVIWKSSQPALAATVRQLDFPAPPPLAPELQLIKAASGWPRESSGVTLIQAVNGLRSLGKRRAIETLEKYVELSDDSASFRELDVVFWIVRLLFEPIRAVHLPSGPAIAVALLPPDTDDQLLWPLEPLEVVNGIPLMAGVNTGLAGMPERPASYFIWARRYGVLRDEPLRPTTDPLTAVEALTRSPKYSRIYTDENALQGYQVNRLRRDALAMVAHLDERLRLNVGEGSVTDHDWNRLRELVNQLGVVWSPVEQQFVRSP